MNSTSPTLPDRETLLKLIVDSLSLNVPVEEAAGRTLTELGIDSLELIELAIELEETHHLNLAVSELSAETTLSDLVDGLLKPVV